MKNQYFRLVVPTTGAVPFTLDRHYLWVSLGRHLPQLREPAVNHQVRQRLAAFAPGLPQVADPKKVEIGVPMTQIDPQRDLDRFAELARFVADALR